MATLNQTQQHQPKPEPSGKGRENGKQEQEQLRLTPEPEPEPEPKPARGGTNDIDKNTNTNTNMSSIHKETTDHNNQKQDPDEASADASADAADAASLPAASTSSAPAADPESLLREFMQDVSEARRSGECERVLGCFKLNPYDILSVGSQEEASAAEIRKAFRQASLLVHPDKCKHPHAKVVFEMVNKAYKDLQDEEVKKDVDATIKHARGELRRERQKLVKKDNAYLAAAALRKGGAEHLEKEYESSKGFQEQLRKKAQELLTQLEWRRRQIGKRLKGEKQRVEEEEQKSAQEFKKKLAGKKTWEKGRDKRVSNWRDFMQKKKKRKH